MSPEYIYRICLQNISTEYFYGIYSYLQSLVNNIQQTGANLNFKISQTSFNKL